VVWLEVAILTTAGALVGTLVGYGLSVLLSLWLAGRTGFVMPVSFAGDEMALLGGLIATGLLAAVLPAALTFRQSVAQGLRGAT
jgi:putative ABC transport system permease protein